MSKAITGLIDDDLWTYYTTSAQGYTKLYRHKTHPDITNNTVS